MGCWGACDIFAMCSFTSSPSRVVGFGVLSTPQYGDERPSGPVGGVLRRLALMVGLKTGRVL